MNPNEMSASSWLTELVQEVRQGSPGAAERFVEAMQPQMVRIVRYTVRQGTARSSQERSILQEYHQVCRGNPAAFSLSGEEIVARVASRLCDRMVGRLQTNEHRQSALETVRG